MFMLNNKNGVVDILLGFVSVNCYDDWLVSLGCLSAPGGVIGESDVFEDKSRRKVKEKRFGYSVNNQMCGVYDGPGNT